MHAEHADSDRLNDLSGRVDGCAFTVLKTFGAGLAVAQQHAARVHYKGALVGESVADLLVEDVLLVELKTVKALDDAHRMQCTNYLKAGGLRLCC